MMTAVPYRFKVGQLVKFSFIESTLYKVENRLRIFQPAELFMIL